MTEAVMAAFVTGVLSVIGTVITVLITSRHTTEEIRINQAVTDTKIEALTREVRSHNQFAQRMPVVEEQIKVINHRLKDLEEASHE